MGRWGSLILIIWGRDGGEKFPCQCHSGLACLVLLLSPPRTRRVVGTLITNSVAVDRVGGGVGLKINFHGQGGRPDGSVLLTSGL